MGPFKILYVFSFAIIIDAESFSYWKPVAEPFTFQLEQPDHSPVDRVREMELINWMHTQNKYVVLKGADGVGKTTIAKNYANAFFINKGGNVIWIDCTSYPIMLNTFRSLWEILVGRKFNNETTPVFKLIRTLRNIFNFFKRRPTLYVFDNANVQNFVLKDISSYVNTTNMTKILITSNDEDWGEKYSTMNIYKVHGRQELSCIERALRWHNKIATQEQLQLLAEALKNFMVTMKALYDHLRKKYPESGRITFVDFLRDLNQHELNTIIISNMKIEDGSNTVDERTFESISRMKLLVISACVVDIIRVAMNYDVKEILEKYDLA